MPLESYDIFNNWNLYACEMGSSIIKCKLDDVEYIIVLVYNDHEDICTTSA